MTQTACLTCGTGPSEQAAAQGCRDCGPDQAQPVPLPGPRPPAYGATVRDPRPLATVAQVAIGLFALIDPVRAAAGVWSHSAAQDSDISEAGRAYSLSTSVSSLVCFAAIVTFLLWFRRCRHNAEAFSPGAVAHAPGWAVGAWFTPVLMWWRPRRIALDIWRTSATDSTTGSTERLIDAWWQHGLPTGPSA